MSPSVYFNHTVTTVIYTLSLHDALPICEDGGERQVPLHCTRRTRDDEHLLHLHRRGVRAAGRILVVGQPVAVVIRDRKSTRLNSSHRTISYAVFCLKKKTTKVQQNIHTQ